MAHPRTVGGSVMPASGMWEASQWRAATHSMGTPTHKRACTHTQRYRQMQAHSWLVRMHTRTGAHTWLVTRTQRYRGAYLVGPDGGLDGLLLVAEVGADHHQRG